MCVRKEHDRGGLLKEESAASSFKQRRRVCTNVLTRTHLKV